MLKLLCKGNIWVVCPLTMKMTSHLPPSLLFDMHLLPSFPLPFVDRSVPSQGVVKTSGSKWIEESSACPLVFSECAVPQTPQHGSGRQCKLAISYLPQLCRIWSGTWWLCQPHNSHCGEKSTLQQMDIYRNSSPSLEQKKVGGDVMT